MVVIPLFQFTLELKLLLWYCVISVIDVSSMLVSCPLMCYAECWNILPFMLF